jgi:hypothetical protein
MRTIIKINPFLIKKRKGMEIYHEIFQKFLAIKNNKIPKSIQFSIKLYRLLQWKTWSKDVSDSVLTIIKKNWEHININTDIFIMNDYYEIYIEWMVEPFEIDSRELLEGNRHWA